MPIQRVPERPALSTPYPGAESAFVAQLLAVLQQHGYAINRLIERASTGTWTPTVTFGGGSTGVTYGASHAGVFYRLDDLVFARALVSLTSKGTDTGQALVGGLPFAVADSVGSTLEATAGFPWGSGLQSLTSAPSAGVGDDESIYLYDWGATGAAVLTDANFTNTTELRLHALYFTDAE